MMKYDIAVIGGDKRTACMAGVFAKKGYRVICYGILNIPADNNIFYARAIKDAVVNAPVIVCGIPFEKQGNLYFEEAVPDVPLTELQRLLRKNQKIFGGVIPEDFRRLCEDREIGCYDFMKEEPLTIFNAIATAEGAILEALLHKDTQLHKSEALVVGFGRCGKVLADKLRGLSAQVTVCSLQANELALADSLGFNTLHLSILPQKVSKYEYLFNTVPAKVFTKKCLENMHFDSILIDIASNRVGIDYEAAIALKRQVFFCPGLPGKYAGLSCAKRLTEYVLSSNNL